MHGKLSTNDGEVALNWALDGLGILMRAEWDVAKYLRSGRMEQGVFATRNNMMTRRSILAPYSLEVAMSPCIQALSAGFKS